MQMPVTRRAILVSNPGEVGQANYCKGVYVDIKNYQRLMTSPEGGAWEAPEIIYLDRPTKGDLRAHLVTAASYNYVFVMFTGHGWYSQQDKDRILELRNGEQIASLELSQGAKKRTVILDCCQRVHPESLLESDARKMAFSQSSRARTPSAATCRRLFFDSIQRAPEGIVKMTSCAIGEVSSDDDTRGGRYNASLIESIDEWTALEARKAHSTGPAELPIVAAHESAAALTRNLSANQQNPTIDKPKSSPYFPIAVFG